MKHCLSLIVVAVVLSMAFMTPTAVAGPKMEIGEDGWLSVSFLGQPHFSYNGDAADEEDFYLRRGRIILKGQVMDGVKFFVETDNDNAGRNGMPASSTDIQDAMLDVRLMKDENAEIWLQGGLILLPFSMENRASATSLLGIDYNAESIRLVNTFVWRDYGAELHGHFGEKVAVRAGVFDGYDAPDSAKNDGADLRLTGRVDLNVLGNVEKGGWFYSQNRLGASEYLVLGAGIDTQGDATLVPMVSALGVTNMVPQDSDSWVVDFQSSFTLGEDMALLVNGAYYDYDNSAFDGNTAFVEGGLLLKGKVMPTLKYSLADPAGGSSATDLTAGLHYFIKGHNARAGVEVTWGDTEKTDEKVLVGLQFLL